MSKMHGGIIKAVTIIIIRRQELHNIERSHTRMKHLTQVLEPTPMHMKIRIGSIESKHLATCEIQSQIQEGLEESSQIFSMKSFYYN